MYSFFKVIDFKDYQCVVRENDVYSSTTLRSLINNQYFVPSRDTNIEVNEVETITGMCKEIISTGKTFTFITIEHTETKERIKIVEVALTEKNDVVWLFGVNDLLHLLDGYLRRNRLRLLNHKGSKGGKTAGKLLTTLESFFK